MQKPIDQILRETGQMPEMTRRSPHAATITELRRRQAEAAEYSNPDGQPRDLDTEFQLNEAAMLTFQSAAGEHLLAYLRSITVHQALGPGGDLDRGLVHLEGARWLVGVIETRIALGERGLPHRQEP